MTPLLVFFLMATAAARVTVSSVRTEWIDGRAAVKVATDRTLGQVGVQRQGSEVVLFVDAESPVSVLAPVPVIPPLESVRVERSSPGTAVWVRVAPGMAYEVRRQDALLIVLFGERSAQPPPRAVAAAIPPPDPPASSRPAPSATPMATPPAQRPWPPAPTPAPTPAAPPPSPSPVAPSREAVTPSPWPAAPPIASPSPEPAAPERAAASPAPAPRPVPPPLAVPSPMPVSPWVVPPPAPTDRPVLSAHADVQELYRQIMPPSAEPDPSATLEPDAEVEQAATAGDEGSAEGFNVGRVNLKPAVSATYVDATGALLDTPAPVHDTYFELRPDVQARVPVGSGLLRASYGARIRRASTFDIVGGVTHTADANLELPIGPSLVLTAMDHFARGALETTEVDPGGEYFFQLGRFTHHGFGVGARVELGTRLKGRFNAERSKVTIDDRAAFFDHEHRGFTAGLGTDLGTRLQVALLYGFDQTPTPIERPQAESRGHSVSLRLDGELGPLLKGHASVGYLSQSNPRAAVGATSYRGLRLDAGLVKEFGRATTLGLVVTRNTSPSAFENNGFYVANALLAEGNVPLPYSFAFRAGVGYHWNTYRSPAAEIGEPRDDRLFTWSLGLGRPVGSWAYVRADYRKDRRDSNLDRLDSSSHVLTIQAGVRLYRTTARP